MQQGVLVDSSNPLNILAVAAGIQHKKSCTSDVTFIAHASSSVDLRVTPALRQSDVYSNQESSSSIVTNIDATTSVAASNNDSASASRVDMKLPPHISHMAKASNVTNMFEEHNYGTCRKNYAYIIADEPFAGDQGAVPSIGQLDGDYRNIVAGRLGERRHDSGYSETNDLDNLKSLDSLSVSSPCDDGPFTVDPVRIPQIYDGVNGGVESAGPKSKDNIFVRDDAVLIHDTEASVPVDDRVAPRLPIAASRPTVITASPFTPKVNKIDSHNHACAYKVDDSYTTTSAAQQTIIKSLLTGRTIIVKPKSDTDSIDSKAYIRASSVTSPASCESLSNVSSSSVSSANVSLSSAIHSPDSAYSTDSNTTDDAFFVRSPSTSASIKNDSRCVDDKHLKTPVSVSISVNKSDSNSPAISAHSSLPLSDNFILSSEYTDDTKASLSRLLVKNCNSISTSSSLSPSSFLNDCNPCIFSCTSSAHLSSIFTQISPITSTPVSTTCSITDTSQQVTQFRIGSFASFSTKIVPTNVNPFVTRHQLPSVAEKTLTVDVPVSADTGSKPTSFFQPISVSPSDILDVVVPAKSNVDHVSLDHDYCANQNSVPLTIQQPKLGRPPTKLSKKRRRKKDDVVSSIPTSPVIPDDNDEPKSAPESLDLASPQISEDVKLTDGPFLSPARRLGKKDAKEDNFDEPEDQDSKVKITGNYQDQFVYYVCKTDRVTRRQRSKLPLVVPGQEIVVPTAADIVVPRLSDADIEALQTGSPPPMGHRVPPLHMPVEKPAENGTAKTVPDDDNQVINAILNLEAPQDDATAYSTCPTNELSALTTEEMNMLFNAIDEIQSKTDTTDKNGVCVKPESGVDPVAESIPASLPLLDTLEPVPAVKPRGENTDVDNTPWIVIVTVYWNDLPAVMLDTTPYVRLIDIYKQILPAKDTGILKKRCQLMGVEVRNCTEMQRYFLVKYGHAHNSKSSLVISKEHANQLIAFYVEPQPKVKSDSRAKKGAVPRRPNLEDADVKNHRQVVTSRGDERPPRPVFADVISNPASVAPSEPLERLRHKKINFRGMLRGGASTDDESESAELHNGSKRPRKPQTKRSLRDTPNNKSVIKSSGRDGARFSRRQPRCRLNGASNNIGESSIATALRAAVPDRLSAAKSDQNTQTASHLSDDVPTDTECTPCKRRGRCVTSSDNDSPSRSMRENMRSGSGKRKSRPFDPTDGSVSRNSSSDGSLPCKRLFNSSMVGEDDKERSSVITLSNGPAEYHTFTALDDELSY